MPASSRYTVEIAASAQQVLGETAQSTATFYGPNRPMTYQATFPDGSNQFERPRRWVGQASELPAPLWPGHLPSGQVTLIVGEAGSGKTAVVLDLLARASMYSVWPDGTSCSKSVVLKRKPQFLYVTRQDDAALYRARLQELGVDLTRFQWLNLVDLVDSVGHGAKHRDFVFPQDLPMLEHEVTENPRQQVLVIDSLADLCDKPYQVSRTLRQLNEMAFVLNIPVLVTLPGKCSINAQGSLRVHSRYQEASAPNVWCVVPHPDDPERTLFLPQRTSQPRKPSGYEFRWGDKSLIWMKNRRIDPLDPLQLRKSIDTFLTELLAHGPVSAQAVLKQGELCGGFTPKQLRAGAARQGILSLKSEGFGAEGRWDWYTPAQRQEKFPDLVVEEIDREPLPMERDVEIGETERADYVEPQTDAERLAAEEEVWQHGRIKPGSRGFDGGVPQLVYRPPPAGCAPLAAEEQLLVGESASGGGPAVPASEAALAEQSGRPAPTNDAACEPVVENDSSRIEPMAGEPTVEIESPALAGTAGPAEHGSSKTGKRLDKRQRRRERRKAALELKRQQRCVSAGEQESGSQGAVNDAACEPVVENESLRIEPVAGEPTVESESPAPADTAGPAEHGSTKPGKRLDKRQRRRERRKAQRMAQRALPEEYHDDEKFRELVLEMISTAGLKAKATDQLGAETASSITEVARSPELTALLAEYPRYAEYLRVHPEKLRSDWQVGNDQEKIPAEELIRESTLQQMIQFGRDHRAQLEETLRQLDDLQQRQIIGSDKALLLQEVYQVAMRLMQEVLDQFQAGKSRPEGETEWQGVINVEKGALLIESGELIARFVTELRAEAAEVQRRMEFIEKRKQRHAKET